MILLFSFVLTVLLAPPQISLEPNFSALSAAKTLAIYRKPKQVALSELRNLAAQHSDSKKSELRERSNHENAPDNLKFAVVGSGAAGIGAAGSLADIDSNQVDVFEALPRPHGLINYGVSDKKEGGFKAKNRGKFERILSKSNIRFIGNIPYGDALSLETLYDFYDGVVFATGAQETYVPGYLEPYIDKGFPIYPAKHYIFYYNGHPSQVDQEYHVGERVIIIGNGNVAKDVLDYVLRETGAKEVIVVARRGPGQTSIDRAEWNDLYDWFLPEVEFHVDREDFAPQWLDATALHNKKSILGRLYGFRDKRRKGNNKRVHFKFLWSGKYPEFDEQNQLMGLKVERNRLVNVDGRLKAEGTGEYNFIPGDTIFYAVGDKAIPLVDLPFDHVNGVVPTENHLINNVSLGGVQPRLAAAGWFKTGPNMKAGTAFKDGRETGTALYKSLRESSIDLPRRDDDILDHLREQKLKPVSYEDYLVLAQYEAIKRRELQLKIIREALNGQAPIDPNVDISELQLDKALRKKVDGAFYRVRRIKRMLEIMSLETASSELRKQLSRHEVQVPSLLLLDAAQVSALKPDEYHAGLQELLMLVETQAKFRFSIIGDVDLNEHPNLYVRALARHSKNTKVTHSSALNRYPVLMRLNLETASPVKATNMVRLMGNREVLPVLGRPGAVRVMLTLAESSLKGADKIREYDETVLRRRATFENGHWVVGEAFAQIALSEMRISFAIATSA